jgi:hypothetical protein
MARVAINTGASANDGLGDNLRAAGGILNSNFLELYTYLGAGSTTVLSAPLWSSTSAGINTLRNVGIGTTNPRFALEVGAVGASGTTLFVNGDARVTGIVTIGPASITLNGITNIINVGTGITINGSTGIISATAIVLGGTTLTGAAVTFITAGSGISVNQGTGNVTITATGTGSTSQWVTTAAGIHTLSNVGIGTTNPTSALTVTGNGTFTGVVTATTFVGALTGTATTATNAQGLTGTPNITVGVVTATTFNSNADVTIYGISIGRGNGANILNTVVGNGALNNSNSGNYNTAYGYQTLYSNTTGYQNTAIGGNALRDNNIGSDNTASGTSALLSNTGGQFNTANGALSLAYNITGNYNTANGYQTLYNTTGTNNTGIGASAGSSISTGSKNTLLGSYTGNQNGLDIRTSNGNVVLSDGDGNIRFYANSSGNVGIGTTNPIEKLTVVGVTSSTSFYGDASYTASGRWTLGANGSSDYTFTGIGFTQTTNDPVLYLARGRVYEFVNNSGGSHPFQIRVSNGGSAYSNGVTNNGGASGVIRFEIPFSAPNTLYYQCTSHSGMGNTISVYPNTI